MYFTVSAFCLWVDRKFTLYNADFLTLNCSGRSFKSRKKIQGFSRKRLRAAHQALVLVLQRAHHGRRVALFDLLLRGHGRLCLLQLLLVQGELDGVGGRLGPQIVHPSLQTLRWEKDGVILNPNMSSRWGFTPPRAARHSPASSRRSACWSACRSSALLCGCSGTGSGQCRPHGRRPSWLQFSVRSPIRFCRAASDHLGSHWCSVKN